MCPLAALLAVCASLPLTVRVHPDVAAALDAGRAVVALESTIISHGMPYPANIQTAREVEEVVRNSGAVPATIAILDGVCCIGLSDDELNRFAVLGAAGKVAKVSRRDLAACVARSGHGGTTVSATMLLADMAGVRVFVTGGIGGVHRGGELSLDISADLCELGRTPVCVVCAGAKSILDIPRTLEFLETQGVAVLALGTDEFPAFFTRRSGCPAPTRVETAHEAAAVVHASSTLGLSSGTLVAVPIPESAEAEAGKVQGAIEQALAEAGAAGVAGRDTTPFLLKRIAELTGGDSLASNIALIKNNAAVGAQIATSLAELQRRTAPGGRLRGDGGGGDSGGAEGALPHSRNDRQPIVVGGAVADLVASPAAGSTVLLRTSSPGTLRVSPGGVGRNIAEGLARLGAHPLLLAAVGDDAFGDQLLSHAASLQGEMGAGSYRYGGEGGGESGGEGGGGFGGSGGVCGIDVSRVLRVSGERTATYTALMDHTSDLIAAIADMDVHRHVTPEYVRTALGSALDGAPLCVADANLSGAALQELARLAAASQTPLWLEPVSVSKAHAACCSLVEAGLFGALTFTSPNEDEAVAMAAALQGSAAPAPHKGIAHAPSAEDVRTAAGALVRAGCRHVLTTRGPQGVLWARRAAPGSSSDVLFEELPALEVDSISSTRGAGDSFVAGAAWALITAPTSTAPSTFRVTQDDERHDERVRAAILCGLRAARLALQTEGAVPIDLSPAAIMAPA
jgi:pseudouridine-5'-phosphate glycosidase/sugar/nucleoside kinase (ribokinase family)